jgi:fucose permease
MSTSSPSISVTQRRLSRARWSTRAQFVVLGILSGAWGAHIPSVKQHYGLNEATLSVTLLAFAVGVLFSLFFVGRVVEKLSARVAALSGGLLMCAALSSILFMPGFAFVLPVAFVFGAAASLFDVSINTEGTELEHVTNNPIMGNLHGMFSTGGMAGAAIVAGLLRIDMEPWLQLVVISAVMAVVVMVAARGMLETHSSDEDGAKKHFAWPRGLLLVLGLLILAGMIAEGVMYDWSVLYLKQEIGMPQAEAALGYAVFSAAMAIARFSTDALRKRFSERKLLFVGGCVAATAMALVLLSANAWVAFIGFALVGAGLALVAPILFSAATLVPGVSRAAAIASVTSIGYAGFMVGPPLIGGIAHASSLTVALTVVVLSAALLAFGSRYVPVRKEE